jgi:hypothetical protein
VYLVLLLAAGAILGGVVVVAMGRGGEMALFRRDLPMARRYPRTPAEVATQRLPLGPVGYQVQATEEALIAAANLLAERDHEIAALRGEIGRLGGDQTAANDREVAGDEQAEDGADAATEAGVARGGSRGSPPSDQHRTEQSWRQ